uniref:histidine kinase n=1 Tax=Candidatus Kentrum eta TaxID=2126337 RepID=A0A450UHQ5_9GAMM|nr:MAG: Signal transduction histidine kinase [Candidatus Kentron sp. H]VFJ93082.1 MAG: Signal transduction histidine kinase [Candidatus Kentron sp. H]VFJ99933.1 MAG: Signal transduction histidine kinase [Candidatus Kentron sp. H]
MTARGYRKRQKRPRGPASPPRKTPHQKLEAANDLKARVLEYIARGNRARAERQLQYLRENARDRPDLLAKSLCDLAKQIPRSDWKLALFEEAEGLNPSDTVTLTSYATALADVGETARALELFQRSLELKGTETVTLNSYATALANVGETARALELFQRALDIEDTNTVTLTSYARALADVGETARALELFQRSLEVKPDGEDTLLQFGLFLEGQDRFEEAIGHLEGIRLGALDRRFAGFVCLNLGRLYYRIHEKTRAADWFERAVDYSDDAMATKLRAAKDILALRPHSPEAVAILQEITEAMPGHRQALGMLRLNLGPKAQYERFGADVEKDEGRDRELLNRAIYHKILNEVAILKMIAYRIADETDSETLRRVIGDIDAMAVEIGRRRNAIQTEQRGKDPADYEELLSEISGTAQDIADFANNGIATIKQRVYELLETPGDTPLEGLQRLLKQIEFTEGGLNDLKSVNEAIRLDIAPFPVRRLFDNWQRNPVIGNAVISVRMENPDSRFHGDERKLEAILKELVDNSRKHNLGRDELQIHMGSRDVNRLPQYVLPGKRPFGGQKYLNITYTDDGEGIPEDSRDWIFQPLKTTSREGSGLGLFIVRRTLRAMGGYVLERGGHGPQPGARFEIYLPYGAEKWGVKQ